MEYEIERGWPRCKDQGIKERVTSSHEEKEPGRKDWRTKEMQFEKATLEQKLKYEMQIEENRKNLHKEQ